MPHRRANKKNHLTESIEVNNTQFHSGSTAEEGACSRTIGTERGSQAIDSRLACRRSSLLASDVMTALVTDCVHRPGDTLRVRPLATYGYRGGPVLHQYPSVKRFGDELGTTKSVLQSLGVESGIEVDWTGFQLARGSETTTATPGIGTNPPRQQRSSPMTAGGRRTASVANTKQKY